MSRRRGVLTLVGALMLLLSSAMHSVLGWKKLSGELVTEHASEPLISGVMTGWLFAGLAMLCFGVIALRISWRFLYGRAVDSFPLFVIGAGYLVFGSWGFIGSGFDPFFLVFLIPALCFVAAAFGPAREVAV